ncbi:MAG: glycerophosphodiester phosphodiesterase [Ignavibacteriales bacterium]|nr:glycerophosphodiester phosphodiesterase [Ignavibacteriales bacterium]MCB9208760.1 glycerophosphodiester phosphodiesterase [Ignavibacteriales bacterium]MCB9218322.1 glycerophosphodiester phosphodiesterase [Ignavibacteriales bacterium]MCB9260618.1 glycerophosphodiester phosphodiesterase [Ignavibacteriales bacterium]
MYKNLLIILLFASTLFAQSLVSTLPTKGICAHRGASNTHPENTLSAFKEAIRLGAHMIEFDVRMTSDNKLVIMHDESVDRTTNGKGKVINLTLNEIKKLDAGSWKSDIFKEEKVPTLEETLNIMPNNIWLNIHLKGDKELGIAVAKVVETFNKVEQSVIACGFDAAEGVKKVNPNIRICNMERQNNRSNYVANTISGNFSFIQLLKNRDDSNLKSDVEKLSKNNIIINYYYSDNLKEIKELFDIGINFILTNNVGEILKNIEELDLTSVNHN